MLTNRLFPACSHVRHRRGAAFVEAVIVIAFLILGLMGLMYFRDVYVTKLRVERLARATALVHGMGGCANPDGPREWVGTRDLHGLTANAPERTDRTAADAETTERVSGGGLAEEADTVVRNLDGLGAEGEGVLNPITDTSVQGRATLRRERLLQDDDVIFEADLGSRSFVSCDDELTYEEDFGEPFERVFEAFDTLVKGFSL